MKGINQVQDTVRTHHLMQGKRGGAFRNSDLDQSCSTARPPAECLVLLLGMLCQYRPEADECKQWMA
jgi:hypothetical protein